MKKIFVLISLIVSILTACNNNSTKIKFEISPVKKTQVEINKDFGINFPKGCVKDKATLEVNSFKNINLIDHKNYKAIGMAYLINFSQKELLKPAKIYINPIKFYSADEIVMGRFDGKHWHYLRVKSNKAGSKWYVTTNKFSMYAPLDNSVEKPIYTSVASNDPIEYVKESINNNAIIWNKLTFRTINLVYKIGGGITMNGGAYILLQAPEIAENLIKGGLVKAGTDTTKDIILSIIKKSIKTPDVVSKNLAKKAIKEALKEYEISYNIIHKYKETGILSHEDIITFIKNQYGYTKLGPARLLYNRANLYEPSKKKTKKTSMEVAELIEKSFQGDLLQLTDATNLGFDIFNIMKLNKIGLGGFQPYLDYVKTIQNIEMEHLKILKRFNISDSDELDITGTYQNQYNEGEVPIRNLTISKIGNDYYAEFSIFYDTDVNFNEKIKISSDEEFPYLFTYIFPGEHNKTIFKFTIKEKADGYYLINSEYNKDSQDWNIYKRKKRFDIDLTGKYFFDKDNWLDIIKKSDGYYLNLPDCDFFNDNLYSERQYKITLDEGTYYDASSENMLNGLKFFDNYQKIEFHSMIYEGASIPLIFCKYKPCKSTNVQNKVTKNENNKVVNTPVNPECNNFKLTQNKYSEQVNLYDAVNKEFGSNYHIADWNDIKRIANLESWAKCMGFKEDETFMVTKGKLYKYGSKRQYFIRYSTNGVENGFMVHAHIGNFYLGSWYGLNANILTISTED